MANRTPEQDLIDAFVAALKVHEDRRLAIGNVLNSKCKAKHHADIEFHSKTGVHWVIEAKSNDSQDKHNTVHKIFGELLKETGRSNRAMCKFAVLIPEEAVHFYSRAFQSIARDKFLAFGSLIPVESVFTFGATGVGEISWENLYAAYEP